VTTCFLGASICCLLVLFVVGAYTDVTKTGHGYATDFVRVVQTSFSCTERLSKGDGTAGAMGALAPAMPKPWGRKYPFAPAIIYESSHKSRSE